MISKILKTIFCILILLIGLVLIGMAIEPVIKIPSMSETGAGFFFIFSGSLCAILGIIGLVNIHVEDT